MLTIIAIVMTREGRLTWLLLALACFTIKEAIYLVPLLTRFDPMNDSPFERGQVWVGAAGWALLMIFTGTMAFRRARTRDNFERAEA